MAGIGEQIKNARKAMGMTQDELAEALNTGRTVVSKWETGNRLPDGETLLRLSKVLDHRFEMDSEPSEIDVSQASRACASQTALETEQVKPGKAEPDVPTALENKRSKLKTPLIIAGIVLVCALTCAFIILLTKKDKPKERPYKAPDEEIYTIARFRQEAENKEGQAWLRVDTSLNVNHGENYDYWLFEFKYHEMNGVALSIDRIEQVYFAREKENVEQIFTAADLRAYGLETDIPAYGDWVFSSGLPVQDTVLGVGVLLRGTDENGAALYFTAYIPFADN